MADSGINPGIYSTLQQLPQAPAQQPSYMDSVSKGMQFGQNVLQAATMGQMLSQMQAKQKALSMNTDPNTGQINQAGYLSTLGRMSPLAAQEEAPRLAQMNKQMADAQTAQLAAKEQTLNATQPVLDMMMKMPASQRSKVWPQAYAHLQAQGVDMSNAPPPDQWSDMWGGLSLNAAHNTRQFIDKQKAIADIGKAPAELNNALYGPRSTTAEIASQYNQQVKPIQSSQMAMNQMIDNYKNPSPQGDASLILNAFKIKFPNAPDVNSLKELAESQSAPDMFKLAATKALKGGLDQGTRENLMRDGISTFRANVDTLRGIQGKYNEMAQAYGVNAKPVTKEKAVDKTFAEAMDLQKQLGPYVPPTERPGFAGRMMSLAAKSLGIGDNTQSPAPTSLAASKAKAALSEPTANASNQAPAVKPGTVEGGYVYMGGDPASPSSWKKSK